MSQYQAAQDTSCANCGQIAWYSDPRVEFGLLITRIDGKPPKKDASIPVTAWVCTICRYVRLQAPPDGLDIQWPID
jgi:hypothetical protein